MKEIKAILLDIDGTLTNSKKEITPKTLQALLTAHHSILVLILPRFLLLSEDPFLYLYSYNFPLSLRLLYIKPEYNSTQLHESS